MLGACGRGHAAAFEIDIAHCGVRMESHTGLAAEVADEAGHDVLGEQHTSGIQPEGAFDPFGIEQGKAARQIADRYLGHRPANTGKHGGRTFGPVRAIAVQRQGSGRRVETLAKVAPEQIPGRERLVDHARVAGVIAVGMADEPMLIHRRCEWIG